MSSSFGDFKMLTWASPLPMLFPWAPNAATRSEAERRPSLSASMIPKASLNCWMAEWEKDSKMLAFLGILAYLLRCGLWKQDNWLLEQNREKDSWGCKWSQCRVSYPGQNLQVNWLIVHLNNESKAESQRAFTDPGLGGRGERRVSGNWQYNTD